MSQRGGAILPKEGEKVEVLVARPDLEVDPRRPVAIEQESSVAQHPRYEIDRSTIQDDEVYRATHCVLERVGQVEAATLECRQVRLAQEDGDVDIARSGRLATRMAAEKVGRDDPRRRSGEGVAQPILEVLWRHPAIIRMSLPNLQGTAALQLLVLPSSKPSLKIALDTEKLNGAEAVPAQVPLAATRQ